MASKFQVTQPRPVNDVGRKQKIPLPVTEASLKQIKQTKDGDVLWASKTGSSVRLTWRMGGGRVQPLLSGMCLFYPSLLAPG